jgi:putative transposon-encoded protein
MTVTNSFHSKPLNMSNIILKKALKVKKGMFIISEDIMIEVEESIKEKGISAELLKSSKVDTF